MSNRDRHVGKTFQQKAAYGRYIQTLDYEPTLNEALDFPSTEQGGEELSESTSKRNPRGYTKNRIREHIKEHWIEWIIGGLVLFGLYLMNESRVTTAIMGKTVGDTSTKVESIQSDLKSLDQKVNTLELQGVINSKDIEYLKDK